MNFPQAGEWRVPQKSGLANCTTGRAIGLQKRAGWKTVLFVQPANPAFLSSVQLAES